MLLDADTTRQVAVVAGCVSAASAFAGAAYTVAAWAGRVSAGIAVLTTQVHDDRAAAQERGVHVATALAGIEQSMNAIREDVAHVREVQAAGAAERGALVPSFGDTRNCSRSVPMQPTSSGRKLN